MQKVNICLKFPLLFFFLISAYGLTAQNLNRIELNDYQRAMERKIHHIPDLPGFVTLKGDFHMHTVFSDGDVWPVTRVVEAWKEGLDVIAITDHIEYSPHEKYTRGDHNVSYEIARTRAEELNIILIQGSEITRSMPPGHFNALFVEDANPIDLEDPLAQIEAAVAQGAFILWNHPGWTSQQPDTTLWWEFHSTILDKGWLHGVEVSNGGEWYPVAMEWCKNKKLTAFANSDIHPPVDLKYDLSLANSHRPMTLVFAKDRTSEGVREALFSRRTIGFTGEQLIGPEDLMLELFTASVRIGEVFLTAERKGILTDHRELVNPTGLTFILEEEEEGSGSQQIRLNPNSMVILRTPAGKKVRYQLVNCWTGGRGHPLVNID